MKARRKRRSRMWNTKRKCAARCSPKLRANTAKIVNLLTRSMKFATGPKTPNTKQSIAKRITSTATVTTVLNVISGSYLSLFDCNCKLYLWKHFSDIMSPCRRHIVPILEPRQLPRRYHRKISLPLRVALSPLRHHPMSQNMMIQVKFFSWISAKIWRWILYFFLILAVFCFGAGNLASDGESPPPLSDDFAATNSRDESPSPSRMMSSLMLTDRDYGAIFVWKNTLFLKCKAKIWKWRNLF